MTHFAFCWLTQTWKSFGNTWTIAREDADAGDARTARARDKVRGGEAGKRFIMYDNYGLLFWHVLDDCDQAWLKQFFQNLFSLYITLYLKVFHYVFECSQLNSFSGLIIAY